MSTSSSTQRSAQEFLSDCENEWARQLRSVSLVAEVQVRITDAEQALRLLSGRFKRLMDDDNEYAALDILRRWPSVQVVSMVQVATDHYDRHNFWTPFSERTGLKKSDGALQRTWGSVFVENLRRIKLPTFDEIPDSGTRYVGRILMHCGMPTYCLPDFLGLIAARRAGNPELTGATFVAEAAAAAARGRLDVDKPVSRFIRYGGDFAVDVAERSIDLIDDLIAGGDGARALLPHRFVRVAADCLRDGLFDQGSGRSRVKMLDEQSTSPRLVLDPYGRGLLIRLPAISDAPDGVASWQVTIDGRRELVKSQALWPGSNEPAPATDFPVSRPTRAALVNLGYRDDGPVSVVPLIDDSDPILFFDQDGNRLPSAVPLPTAPTWLVYANDDMSTGVSYEGAQRVIATGRVPAGWSGWTAELVDLAHVKRLALAGTDRSHAVRGTQSARISTGAPIEGLRTPYGTSVYAQRPKIELPSSGAEDTLWEVAIADGRGQILVRQSISATDAESNPWDGVPGPLLGAYRLQIRGPWGRGATRSVVLAEEVHVDCRPTWRRFARGGLRPVEVEVRVRGGLTVDARTISFGPSRRAAPVVISSASHAETFLLTPPHMTVSYETSTQVGQERIQPISLEAQSLIDEPGSLLLRLGQDVNPELHVLCGGSLTQVVPPAARAAQGIYRFDLVRIAETVRDRGAALLALDAAGDVVVASVRPRQLAAGIVASHGGLRFEGSREIDGLTAAAYLLRAPWRGPAVCPVTDGRADLPPEYRDAGPLYVSSYIDDPWLPVVPPTWPRSEGRVLVDAVGSLISDEPGERSLSAFLAGEGKVAGERQDLSRLWVVLESIDSLQLGGRASDVRAQCQAELRSRPAEAVAALADAGLAPSVAPAVLVSSGVLSRALPESSSHKAAWPASPIGAAMGLRGALATGQTREIDAAVDFCGPAIEAILRGEGDPFRRAGQFDAAADFYAAMSDEARAALRTAAAFVPKAMLDADTRSESAMRLAERHRDGQLKATREASARLLREAQTFLQSIDDKRLYWAVQARAHPHVDGGWQALSALSLAFAILTRLAAYQRLHVTSWLDAQAAHWTALAGVAPELTNVDLVLAELLCLAPSSRAEQGSQP